MCIRDSVNVVLTKKGVSETKLMTRETLFEEMGITPAQITDLKALMGDASDNIPGIAGIGEKTALKLLHDYPTIEELYEHKMCIRDRIHILYLLSYPVTLGSTRRFWRGLMCAAVIVPSKSRQMHRSLRS